MFAVKFFVFKQKTAYDVRISDWSSDVCASDLVCRDWFACIEPIPANIYTHKTLSGSFSVKNRHLVELLKGKSKDSDAIWNSIQIGRASCRERVCQYV